MDLSTVERAGQITYIHDVGDADMRQGLTTDLLLSQC